MAGHQKYLGWEKPGKGLITGTSDGLGLCFAGHFAQKGFDLILAARWGDRLEQAAAKISSDCGVRCEILPADLSDMEQIGNLSSIAAFP